MNSNEVAPFGLVSAKDSLPLCAGLKKKLYGKYVHEFQFFSWIYETTGQVRRPELIADLESE